MKRTRTHPPDRVAGNVEPSAIETTRSILLSGQAPSLPEVMAWIDGVCRDIEVGIDVSLRLRLLLEEVVTNILAHGYGPDGDGTIEVACVRRSDGTLMVEIKDAAPPFDPLIAMPPQSLSDDVATRTIGGLGLYLVQSLTTRQNYRRENGNNILSLLVNMSNA